jgi:hypothetical protein
LHFRCYYIEPYVCPKQTCCIPRSVAVLTSSQHTSGRGTVGRKSPSGSSKDLRDFGCKLPNASSLNCTKL